MRVTTVCGRVQTAAVLVQATVLLSPQSFQFSVLAKCLSVCPAFFCQRDAGESEKEIWNRWKKILSITFPQTYSLFFYCAKVSDILNIFCITKLGMKSWYIWGLMLESDMQCSHKIVFLFFCCCKNGISTSSKGRGCAPTSIVANMCSCVCTVPVLLQCHVQLFACVVMFEKIVVFAGF